MARRRGEWDEVDAPRLLGSAAEGFGCELDFGGGFRQRFRMSKRQRRQL